MREAQKTNINQHPPNDGENHHRQLRRLQQRTLQLPPPHPVCNRYTKDNKRTQCSPLGRSSPRVSPERIDDKPHDHQHNEKDRQGRRQRTPPLAPRKSSDGRSKPPNSDSEQNHQSRINDRRKNSRHEPRQQKSTDILLDNNRIDHQQRRRRNQRCQSSPRRHNPRREPLVVANPPHFRDGNLCKNRRSRNRSP